MKEDSDTDPAKTRDMLTPSRIPVADGLHNREDASGSGRLEVRCPNCHQPTEVAVDTTLTDLTCSACGSHFSLVDQSKATRLAPSLSKLGRFELIERLGVGGFGSVWKARDKDLDRTVAIKIPRAGGMTPEEQEKFFREARAAAQLRHPDIVSVHEVGRDGDSLYIVSDYVRGATLGDWLTGQQLTNREAAELCAIIADALQHAHEHGIVHRDLKPANIMMDGDNQPHLMDFGLARREVGEVTVTVDGQVLGTPAYMSPEQAQGEAHTADCRSDVYSLGVILFQLLSGELPFRGNARMLIKQVIDDEPPSPRKLNGNVPKDLETITLKCLEKEPAKRFQTASEFSDECRRYLSGDPIHSRPISRIARTWRWAKRSPAAAALLAVLAALAVVGPLLATQQLLIAAQRARLLAQNRMLLGEKDMTIAQREKAIAERNIVISEREKAVAEKQKALSLLASNNKELQSQLVRNLIERGAAQLDDREVSRAVAFFAAAYAMARPDDPLKTSARNLVAGWGASLGPTLIHDEAVRAVAFSPDGRTVLTGSYDKTARLWNAATGKPIGEPMRHGNSVTAVAFSSDGRTVLTGSYEKTARLWNAATGKPIGEPMRHDNLVTAVAFSSDGRTVLTGSYDKTARLWNAATGKPIGEPMRHDNSVTAVAFSSDGRTVLTGSNDKTARLWNAATGKPIGEPMRHGNYVRAVAFSPDGRTVLTGSDDRTARLWDAATGKPIGEPMHHGSWVRAVAFSPDGRTVLTGSYDNTARLWYAATGKPIGEPMHHDGSVTVVAFSPDGRTVLAGSFHWTARLWDAATGKSIGEPMQHGARVDAAAFSPDGCTILTGSDDKTARLWNAATGKPIGEPMRHDGSVNDVAFSPERHTVLTGSDDKTARLWNAATGKPIGEPMRHDNWVTAVAFSSDGRTVLTGSYDKTARLWNAATGKPIGEPMRHGNYVRAVAFSPDCRTVLTGSDDRTARLWDAATGKPIGEPMHHGSWVRAVAFSSDGRTVLTGSNDKTARLWNAATGKPIGEPMHHGSWVRAVAFSSDGRTVLTGSEDRTAHLWEAATGKPIGEPMRHVERIRAVAFSPEGRTVLTGSNDDTARLWDAATGKPIGDPMRHSERVVAVAFSPDGRTILTASDDKTARLWDAATGKPIGEPMRHGEPVEAVAFSGDGRTVLTGSRDNTARLWQVPRLPDSSELVSRWAALKTGLSLDAQGLLRRLSQAEWQAAIDEFDRLRAELRDPAILSWMERRDIPGFAPYDARLVAVEKAAHGLFVEAVRAAVQLGGPDALNRVIGAALAHSSVETRQPIDLLMLGELRLVAGHPQSAEAAMRAAIKKDASKHYFYKSLGLSLFAQGKTDEARLAFQEVLKNRKRKDDTYALEKADPDQLSAAYFLDLVSEEVYAESFSSDKELACFPWFYIAQRREIEGKKDDAIKAYERCVELSTGGNPHTVQAMAEWRLRKLIEPSKSVQE